MGFSQPSKRVHKKADRKGHSSRQKGARSTRTVDAASSSRVPVPPQVVPCAASSPCTCSECLQGSLHAYHPCCLWALQAHFAAHYATTLPPLCSSMASSNLSSCTASVVQQRYALTFYANCSIQACSHGVAFSVLQLADTVCS